jgi:Zn-dependent protease with chaperone function/uncharacterized tellurite resistance protein B-like protein
MTSFFEHQDEARRNSRWLVLAMLAAVLGTGFGLYGLVLLVQYGALWFQPALGYAPELWHPRVFFACVAGTALVVVVASGFRLLSMRGGGARVAEMLGGRLVSGQPRDVLERRLLNVVEEMAIASGVPVPQVFVMDAEAGINAFAAGFELDDAAVAVTRGTLEKLTRDELQGVIAHEFSHVLNGDMRLHTRMMGVVYGILCIGLCGRVLMRVSLRTSGSSGRGKKNGGAYLFVIGLGVFLVGWLGELSGKLIKAALSRQREFLADASAVQFTRNPTAITGALKKIGGYELGATIQTPAAEEASHLFFCDLYERLFAHSWLATHPPLAERILRLDPSFAGEFPAVSDAIAQPEDAAQIEASAPVAARLAPAAHIVSPAHAGIAAAGGLFLAAAQPESSGSLRPEQLVAAIGTTTQHALEQSHDRLAALPSALREAAESPFSAGALIYALLLVDNPEIERQQFAKLSALSGGPLAQETQRLRDLVRGLVRSEQLLVVELVAPALRQLSAEQRLRFSRTLDALMQADRRVSIFEHVVGSMLSDRLSSEADLQGRARVRHKHLRGVQRELALVLSLLAHAGDVDGSGASAGFSAATARLALPELGLLPASERLISALGAALGELRGLPPQLAAQVVDACAHVVLADRRVSDDELTLLRVICDSLRCPVPLLDRDLSQA